MSETQKINPNESSTPKTSGFSTKQTLPAFEKNLVKKYKDKNIDSIVLGCTHYPLIKKEIRKYFPNVKLIDGNKGVAKRVKYQLEENSFISKSNEKGIVTIINNK